MVTTDSPRVIAAMAARGIDAVDATERVAMDAQVVVMDPRTAKGLEFDAVIVDEPSAIASLPNGLRLLYVALTRAVQHLGVFHSSPLPVALR